MIAARLFDGFTFKVADEVERGQALELRANVYNRELGNPGLDSRDEVASHLVALDRDRAVVAALRVIGPRDRPFDLEQFVALDSLLPEAAQPAEVSRFCVAPSRRAVQRGQVVHLGMLKLLYEFARRRGITDIVTMGLPNLQKIYRVAFFVPLGIGVNHPIWGPAQVMRFSLAETRRLHGESEHPIARLLFRTDTPNVHV